MLIPLFPLKTVLFPDGLLPLKVFEQRYIEMTKACLRDATPFGVCMIQRGEEVARDVRDAPSFATFGTIATILAWDMPQMGIMHLKTAGRTRFKVENHRVEKNGLVMAEVSGLEPEPAVAIGEAHLPLVQLLEVLMARAGPENFPSPVAIEDASWVSYRLAEVLPLPLNIKQGMLEINDSGVRLSLLAKFLQSQGVLQA